MEKTLGFLLCIVGFILMNFSCSLDGVGMYYTFLGTLQAKNKQNVQAIASYSQAIASTSPESRRYARYGLATVYADMGESRSAITLYDGIIHELSDEGLPTKGPEKELMYRALYNRGLCLYGLEDFDGAVEAFRSALLIDGSRWNAKRNLELSLLAKTKKRGSAASAGAVSTIQQNLPNPVLFEYIRQKEIDRWKSQQSKSSEESSIDY
ncbi:tetratricopeptide repeat protein [Gracilinema caldarium]|uniref:Tetratricopeptide TPR_1 repeat-containing protein n=1 Tax=Gracilinema caldarium (strain ATCC 51460 / DSM 7334 / H1) TaxID=744872 RepID=F8F3W8_GRAC1|nr:tetratricopeptide repeat protein [Gracilinema caldarium]AEJ20487.1 Tetratricopeptide TPR_1 repeat-containing protein [Gracilinema caldarium DSM 7334]